ncbi:YcxB family protein [Raoultibacter phocaeensis]|uniref:YcxB family protein n=1 Tax=Raoultibacter phocaeensis TaxID=2479841 RepID=UPI00111AC840|nr:YcxB family protein [Raoultibacter phocaeensis]
MDAVARNRVTLNAADYREWLDGTYLKALNSVALSVSLLLAFMCSVLLAFDVFFHIANHGIMVAVAVIVAVLIAVRFAVPAFLGYAAFCREARRFGKARRASVTHDVAVYDDRIEARSEGDENECIVMRSCEIDKVSQTAHLLVVTCKKKGSLLVKKEAFSPEELAMIERLADRGRSADTDCRT